MNKEQLLACLKPLYWSYESNAQGINSIYYHISKRSNGFLLYQVDMLDHFERLDDVTYETNSLARFAAQNHYNNLVLQLFDLE